MASQVVAVFDGDDTIPAETLRETVYDILVESGRLEGVAYTVTVTRDEDD